LERINAKMGIRGLARRVPSAHGERITTGGNRAMTAPTSVLLADDHLPTRGLIRMILEDQGFRVVAEASSGEGAVEQALSQRPTACLLDVEMPAGGGLHALREIGRRLPETACVMLSSSEDDRHLLAALRAGALGFLSKEMDLDRLPDALRGVLRGEAAVPRSRMSRVLQELRAHAPPGPAPAGRRLVDLSEEEWQVVQDLRAAGRRPETSRPRR
jgi:DNA-binding NarL/FixJ family response regulator